MSMLIAKGKGWGYSLRSCVEFRLNKGNCCGSGRAFDGSWASSGILQQLKQHIGKLDVIIRSYFGHTKKQTACSYSVLAIVALFGSYLASHSVYSTLYSKHIGGQIVQTSSSFPAHDNIL
jgi:hypothetical protein